MNNNYIIEKLINEQFLRFNNKNKKYKNKVKEKETKVLLLFNYHV